MREVRKCSDIPDYVFLQAVMDAPVDDPRARNVPAEGAAGMVWAMLIQQAVKTGGWRPRTPHHTPESIYKTLCAAMGTQIPIKVFYAKAEKLDRERALLNTYGRRWHLAEECLDYGCCGEERDGGAPEPATDEEIAFMNAAFDWLDEEGRRSGIPPMLPYDLGRAASIVHPTPGAVRDA